MPRIAIPIPTSFDLDYNRRNWPAYAAAISAAGGEPVEVPLNLSPHDIATLAATCHAILLPGSPADVDAALYGQQRDPAAAPADPAREAVDRLLLEAAHRLRLPLLCICFGTQFLNVWRGGTLVQDLAPLPVNHSARAVAVAHTALIDVGSLLATLVDPAEAAREGEFVRLGVNSSHHQALGIAGADLRVVARCPQDGVVEAVEAVFDPGAPTAPEAQHFVLGLQWHPERTAAVSATSRALFTRFVEEAARWQSRAATPAVSAD